jgi:putative chitinase
MTASVTPEQLATLAGRSTPLMPALADWLNALLPGHGIDAPREVAHFLAQACHETDHFRTLREYASGAAYEGRTDLGNTQPGDGVRFRGRGIFQTTGRANYLELGIRRRRRDLYINQPELLETPEHAVWSACVYWELRRLNDVANHADADLLKKKHRGRLLELVPVDYISYSINGGSNGLKRRRALYTLACSILQVE